jgi:hypothetical protein
MRCVRLCAAGALERQFSLLSAKSPVQSQHIIEAGPDVDVSAEWLISEPGNDRRTIAANSGIWSRIPVA